MNQQDRERMGNLLDAVTKFASKNPKGGMATITPKALSEFASACDVFMTQLRRTIMAIARSDSPDEDADGELAELASVGIEVDE